jgi:hypothetical protein
MAAHAAVGCVSSAMAGGSCGSGAMSAGFSSIAGPLLPGGGSQELHAVNMLGRVIVGAIGSKLGGGKAENGALTAAFEYLFNQLQAMIWRPRPMSRSVGHVAITDEWGRVLESQYRENTYPIAPNTTKNLAQTIAAQGREPDAIYRIETTHDQLVLARQIGADEGLKRTWQVVGWGPNVTNCSIAADNILDAVNPSYKSLSAVTIPSPWALDSQLFHLSRSPRSGVTQTK